MVKKPAAPAVLAAVAKGKPKATAGAPARSHHNVGDISIGAGTSTTSRVAVTPSIAPEAPPPVKDEDIQTNRVNGEVMRGVRRLVTSRYNGSVPSHGTISVEYRVRNDGSIDLPKETRGGRAFYPTIKIDRSVLSGLTGDEQGRVVSEIHSQIERILGSQRFQTSGNRDASKFVPIRITF